MTPQDLAKIRERLDKTNDARTPVNQMKVNDLMFYGNARRDITRLLGYVAELERDCKALREMRGTSEHVTTYQHVRPANHTIRPDLMQAAGSSDLPIVEAVESVPLAELIRSINTGMIELAERLEHEDTKR